MKITAKPKAIMVIVGIDFGSTNSSVAYWRNGKVTVVEVDQIDRSIPSCVAFNKNGILVGAPALRQMAKNSQNTIFDIKRLLGCDMADAEQHTKENQLPYKLENDHENPKIQALYKEEKKTFYPEEIIALILFRLKEITHDYVGEEISYAVITVPTSFNALQRRILMEAASIAEVPLLGLVNETTAAAISHGLNNLTDTRRTTLVFHLGGGSFDVALIKIKKDIYDVMATCGNARLGGQNFTNSLVKECVRIFNAKEGTDISGDLRALSKLRFACDKAKADLGLSKSTSIEVEALYNGNDFEYIVTEETFETLNKHLVEEMRESINRVLAKGGINKEKVHDVIAVGAATRMKLVKKLLSEYEFESAKTINTNEAVATGAAVYAAYRSGDWPVGEFVIRDVLSHELAIYYASGEEGVLFKRGHAILDFMCPPRANSCSNFEIRCMTKSCRDKRVSLTYGKYSNIILKGDTTRFVITADGIPEVSVRTANGTKTLKHESTKAEGVDTLRKKASEYRLEDDQYKTLEKNLHELEKCAYAVKENVGTDKKICTAMKKKYIGQCDKIIGSLEEMAKPSEDKMKLIEAELDELRKQIDEETRQIPPQTSSTVDEGTVSQNDSKSSRCRKPSTNMDELGKEAQQVNSESTRTAFETFGNSTAESNDPQKTAKREKVGDSITSDKNQPEGKANKNGRCVIF